MLRPVIQESVTQIIVDQIIELIAQTPLHAGDKLPSEKELMAALNVSRPTVREAQAESAIRLRYSPSSWQKKTRGKPRCPQARSDIVVSVVQRAAVDHYEMVLDIPYHMIRELQLEYPEPYIDPNKRLNVIVGSFIDSKQPIPTRPDS